MDKEQMLDSINSLNFIDVEVENDICHAVMVKADKYTEEVLRQLGKSDQYIKVNVTEQEDFNLCYVAWDYASYFDGVEFTND